MAYAPAPTAMAAPSITMRLAGERAAVRRSAPAARGEWAQGAAGTAQAWRLMQLDRPTEAAAAFRAMLATGSARERSDAAYGLSLAYLKLGLTTEADTAASAAPQTNERVSEIRLAVLGQRIQAAYNAGDYTDALIDLDSRARLAPELTYLMSLRGWSYYHLERYEEAERLFEALVASGNQDAVSALDLTRAKLGGPANADVK
jgi:tetratricopeptide (TPR) repeat protein